MNVLAIDILFQLWDDFGALNFIKKFFALQSFRKIFFSLILIWRYGLFINNNKFVE